MGCDRWIDMANGHTHTQYTYCNYNYLQLKLDGFVREYVYCRFVNTKLMTNIDKVHTNEYT